MKLLTTLLICALVAPFAVAQSTVRPQSLFTTATASASSSGGVGGVGSEPVKPSLETVDPGDCHTNNDGVEVCNDTDSDGDFTMDPKSGNSNSATTVEAKNDAEGTVEGLDSNDTVNCAHGSNVAISGDGGTVNANSGSSGSVTNTGAPGGGSITVNIGSGSITVPPGGTINFTG